MREIVDIKKSFLNKRTPYAEKKHATKRQYVSNPSDRGFSELFAVSLMCPCPTAAEELQECGTEPLVTSRHCVTAGWYFW